MFGSIGIAPSILSADFMNLERDIRMIEEGGADWIHVDVMDGHFVPNLTIGVPHVKALKRMAKLPLDVHLMISNPERQVPWFIAAGADMVTVHIEATQDPIALLESIKEAGCKAAIAINPPTPIEAIRDCIPHADMVLVMSVNPGFSGQSFMPECIQKVAQVSAWAKQDGVDSIIEVDGGIGVKTAALMTSQGADLLVCGNACFGAPDPKQAISDIRKAGESF